MLNDHESTKDLLIGFGLVVLGAAITVGTWIAAEPGGSYWFLWGFMLFGLFYLFRGFFSKVADSTEVGKKFVWVLVGLTTFGIMIFGGFLVMDFMTTPELAPPEDTELIWEDNSYWQDEAQSTFMVSGFITNTNSDWAVENVYIEVEAEDAYNKLIGKYRVTVTPSIIPPNSKGSYSRLLQMPFECEYATPVIYWEWVLK